MRSAENCRIPTRSLTCIQILKRRVDINAQLSFQENFICTARIIAAASTAGEKKIAKKLQKTAKNEKSPIDVDLRTCYYNYGHQLQGEPAHGKAVER